MKITSVKFGGKKFREKPEAERLDTESLLLSRRLFLQSDEVKSYQVGFRATNGRVYYIEIEPHEWEEVKKWFDKPISSGNWFRKAES